MLDQSRPGVASSDELQASFIKFNQSQAQPDRSNQSQPVLSNQSEPKSLIESVSFTELPTDAASYSQSQAQAVLASQSLTRQPIASSQSQAELLSMMRRGFDEGVYANGLLREEMNRIIEAIRGEKKHQGNGMLVESWYEMKLRLVLS